MKRLPEQRPCLERCSKCVALCFGKLNHKAQHLCSMHLHEVVDKSPLQVIPKPDQNVQV